MRLNVKRFPIGLSPGQKRAAAARRRGYPWTVESLGLLEVAALAKRDASGLEVSRGSDAHRDYRQLGLGDGRCAFDRHVLRGSALEGQVVDEGRRLDEGESADILQHAIEEADPLLRRRVFGVRHIDRRGQKAIRVESRIDRTQSGEAPEE